MLVAMIGNNDAKKKLIQNFLENFNQLKQDDVSVEDISDEEIEYAKYSVTPMYEIKCKIDDQDVVVTYCKNQKGVFTYQVKFKEQTIQFYSDGYLKINGKFIDKNFGDNGENGDDVFLKEFNSVNTKFQSFVNYIKNNTSACDLDMQFENAKFTQREMRRKLKEDYNKTSYTDNEDGTFDVKIGENNYQTSFIHFQKTFDDLHFDSDCYHGGYTYSKLDENFVNSLWCQHKKKSATMFAFNNEKNINTKIYEIPPFSVGMMFGKNNDILDYFESDIWHTPAMVTSKVGARYKFKETCNAGEQEETKLIKVALDALGDKNLLNTDKYQLLFSQIEHREKNNMYYNGGKNSYDKDFYFSGDEAIMLTKGNNRQFDVKNFCIQMNFSDLCESYDIGNNNPSSLSCHRNKREPTIKWNESFKYEGGEFPNGIKPEVEKIVEANNKLGHKYVWILDYGNAPCSMIKVENSVKAVEEYFNFRYKQVEAERKNSKIIHKTFMLKEEQDGKKIDNENKGKINDQQIDNISNLQSVNQRNDIKEPITNSNPNMLNTQQTQNNRHPLGNVCGFDLSWIDCFKLCKNGDSENRNDIINNQIQ